MTQAQVDAHQIRQRASKSHTEAPTEHFAGPEKALHELCLAEARRRRFYVVHSRTDQRTTQQKGTPDLILAMPKGKTVWIEIKVGKNQLSPEQAAAGYCLRALDHHFYVVRNFAEFLMAIE